MLPNAPAIESLINSLDQATIGELRSAAEYCWERGEDFATGQSKRPLYRDFARLIQAHLDR